jgi:hypothetical protein
VAGWQPVEKMTDGFGNNLNGRCVELADGTNQFSVLARNLRSLGMFLDEYDRTSPTRERLETECTRAGVQVEHARIRNCISGFEGGEHRFAHAVTRGARMPGTSNEHTSDWRAQQIRRE